MDNGGRYRKEFDLIFQEIDEKERLQRQAFTQPRAELLKLLSYKSIRRFLSGLSVEERLEFIGIYRRVPPQDIP